MQRETGIILDSSGISLDWRALDDSSATETYQNLVIARFSGECTVYGTPSPRAMGALAFTHITDGEILPFVNVDCDKVRWLIEPELRERAGARDYLYGRALGRVLAHELYHILAKTRHHGKGGVGKPAFTPEDLIRERLQLDEPEQVLVRRRREPFKRATAERETSSEIQRRQEVNERGQ